MTDRFTVRAVVIGLLIVTLAVVGALVYALGVVSLAPEQRGTIIGALVTLGSGASGAVAGILARTTSVPPAAEALANVNPLDPPLPPG